MTVRPEEQRLCLHKREQTFQYARRYSSRIVGFGERLAVMDVLHVMALAEDARRTATQAYLNGISS